MKSCDLRVKVHWCRAVNSLAPEGAWTRDECSTVGDSEQHDRSLVNVAVLTQWALTPTPSSSLPLCWPCSSPACKLG